MNSENPYNAYILIKQNPEDKDYFAIINGKATFLKGIKSDKKYIVADVHITKDMGNAQIGEAVHFYTLETLTKEDLLNYDVSKSCLCSYAEKDTFTTFRKLKDFEGYFCNNKIFFKTESGVYYFSVNEFVGSFKHSSLYDNSFEIEKIGGWQGSDILWDAYYLDIGNYYLYISKHRMNETKYTCYLCGNGMELLINQDTSFEWVEKFVNFIKPTIPIKDILKIEIDDFQKENVLKSFQFYWNNGELLFKIIYTKQKQCFLYEESYGYRDCFLINNCCELEWVENLKNLL